jgi:hypothetical protein
MVLAMARQEAGLRKQRLNSRDTLSLHYTLKETRDAQIRVGKQLKAARKLTQNRQSNSLDKSQLTLSSGVDEGVVVAAEDDDG